jgi:hypothetical protein
MHNSTSKYNYLNVNGLNVLNSITNKSGFLTIGCRIIITRIHNRQVIYIFEILILIRRLNKILIQYKNS